MRGTGRGERSVESKLGGEGGGGGVVFFFKQKTAYEILTCDWSSDVCSSDLGPSENRYFFTKKFWSSILSEIVSQTHVGVVIDVVNFQIPQVVCC